jgi:hypothetical protein
MIESSDEKVKTPLLKTTEKYADLEAAHEKSPHSTPSIQSIRTEHRDILSTMPAVAIQTIAEQLYNKRGEDKKIAPSKDIAKLKATSRHFYGKDPDTACLPNTKKYADKSVRFFTCELGLELLELDKRPDYRDPREINKCHDCMVAATLCYFCLPITISSGIVGCLFGCIMDTRNAIRSARIKNNRPQEPEQGYLSIPLSSQKPPDQSMV